MPGDDTGGTGHTQVYESSDNMLVSNSNSENHSESDMDLEMTSFLMMKSIQALMMESIFQQMKFLKGF